MKLIFGILFLLTTSLFAVDFVIPEVQAKFDSLDASVAAIEALADGKILLGNASGAAAEVTPSGDVTISNAGVTAITAGSVVEADLAAISADGLHAQRVARATWDYDVDGGTTGAIDLGVDLPANALINLAYFYVVTQVTDGGTGTGALHCEDADNLYAAADVSGNAAGTVVMGIPQNGAANMVKGIGAACDLTWTIAGANATAGKIIFFVHYTIVE